MKYIKKFENYKLTPMSDKDIIDVFTKLQNDLKILGITIEINKQEYGMPDDQGEHKFRYKFEIDSNIGKIENSILNILIFKMVKEPFISSYILFRNQQEIITINEFPNEHSEHLMKESDNYINPQTKTELYNNIIEKVIGYYQDKNRINKLKVTTVKLAPSSTSNLYTDLNIKQTIIDYLNSLLNKSEIPENILHNVIDGISHKTVYFIKNNEPFTAIYNGLKKIINKDELGKSSNLGEMGFDD